MKILFSTLAALLIAACFAQANSTRDAQFYLNNPEKYEGQKIVLYTAFVQRQRVTDDGAAVIFSAYTMSRDEDETSYIHVVVPKAKADAFARRYGTDFKYQGDNIRKLSMRGTLEQIDDTWFLDMTAED
jgi:predicted 2-oxoglutarate/Fe(II)-dependent dioxygenase YbiX